MKKMDYRTTTFAILALFLFSAFVLPVPQYVHAGSEQTDPGFITEPYYPPGTGANTADPGLPGGGTTVGGPGGGSPTVGGPGGGSPTVGGPGGGGDAKELKNPLKVTSIEAFLLAIINVLLIFALPIIIFFIIYAGFLFVTARGDTAQISTAKSALMWAVVGGVVVLGAQAIIAVIQGTISLF